MESRTFQVPNIGCNGCVNTIRQELLQVQGVQAVEGEAASKTIRVEYDAPASWEQIVTLLKEIDYAPAEA